MKKKAQTRFTPFFAKTLNPAQSLPLSLSLSLLIDLLRSLRSHISVVLPLPSLPHPPPLLAFVVNPIWHLYNIIAPASLW